MLVKPPRYRPQLVPERLFPTHCRDVAADRGDVDLMLPVVRKSQVDKRFQKRGADALSSPRRYRTCTKFHLP